LLGRRSSLRQQFIRSKILKKLHSAHAQAVSFCLVSGFGRLICAL
jgi:hypothetical protein